LAWNCWVTDTVPDAGKQGVIRVVQGAPGGANRAAKLQTLHPIREESVSAMEYSCRIKCYAAIS